MQDCSNSSALAMELLQSCTKPSTWDDIIYPFSKFGNGQVISSHTLWWMLLPIHAGIKVSGLGNMTGDTFLSYVISFLSDWHFHQLSMSYFMFWAEEIQSCWIQIHHLYVISMGLYTYSSLFELLPVQIVTPANLSNLGLPGYWWLFTVQPDPGELKTI